MSGRGKAVCFQSTVPGTFDTREKVVLQLGFEVKAGVCEMEKQCGEGHNKWKQIGILKLPALNAQITSPTPWT